MFEVSSVATTEEPGIEVYAEAGNLVLTGFTDDEGTSLTTTISYDETLESN